MSPAFQLGRSPSVAASPARFGTPARAPSSPSRFGTPARTPSSAAPEKSEVVDTAYDESGLRLVTAHADSSIQLWTRAGPESWAVTASFPTSHAPGTLRRAVFAPARLSPGLVATIGRDGLAAVYRVSGSGEGVVVREQALRDAAAPLEAVAMSPEGLLATVGEERVVRIYAPVDSGARWGLLAAVDVRGAAGLSFAPGGAALIAGGDLVARTGAAWEWEVRLRIEGEATDAHWGAAGLLAVARVNGDVEVWRLEAGVLNMVACMRDPDAGAVTRVVWDHAGHVVGTAHDDGRLRTWARLPQIGGGEWTWGMRDCVEL